MFAKDANEYEVILKTLRKNRVEIRSIVIRPHAVGNDTASYIFISVAQKLLLYPKAQKLILNKGILIYTYFEIGF